MLQKFLDLVGEPRIPIANSFEWLTKQEVVEKIRDLDGCAAIRESVSCTTSRNVNPGDKVGHGSGRML
jgi:hypothetical protein